MGDLDLDNIDLSGIGEAEDQTNEDIERIKRAVANERGCPELLQFEEQLVEDLQEMVTSQQAHVDDAKEQPDDMEAFGISLYQMEIDRVKYLLASYLRTRLRKIEKFVFHILGSEEEFSKLSSNEVAFASKYMEAVERHLKESCLDQIPDKFRDLRTGGGNTGSVAEPALDSFVFCRIQDDLGEVQMDDRGEQQSTLNKGDVHVLRYRPIRQLVADGVVDLM